MIGTAAVMLLSTALAHAAPVPACAEGPLSRPTGLMIGHAYTLCAGDQQVSSTDGLLVGGATGLGGHGQLGVVGLIPLHEHWPRLAVAHGAVPLWHGGRIRTAARAALGYVRLPARDRSAAVLSGGVSASWRPSTGTTGLGARTALHLGLSGWTGAGQPLGTPIELSRGGALVTEAGADVVLTPALSLTLEAIAPALVLDSGLGPGRLAAVAYGLRGFGERVRLDVGFVKGTGAAAPLDALRLGFPLIRLSGNLRPVARTAPAL